MHIRKILTIASATTLLAFTTGTLLSLKSSKPELEHSSKSGVSGLEYLLVPDTAKTIVIDPGHDKDYTGRHEYLGRKKGYMKEEELNLNLAYILKDSLEKDGYKVFLTHSTLEGLNRHKINLDDKKQIGNADEILMRVNYIDSINPDITIALHYNANTNSSKMSGTELYFYGIKSKRQLKNNRSDYNDPSTCKYYSEPSRFISEEFRKYLAENNIQARTIGSDFLLCKELSDKAIIFLETAYLTNRADRERWANHDGQIETASLITNFINKNYGTIMKVNHENMIKKYPLNPIAQKMDTLYIDDIFPSFVGIPAKNALAPKF